jgi:hypothetical protein
VLGLLSDEYPKICRFSTCVYPSENNDVVTSPYNVMLATGELIEHADCVFPLDNSALFGFSQREVQLKTGRRKDEDACYTGNTLNSNTNKPKDKGFDAINSIAARMLCHLTSSSRFHGEMNVDLNEIYTNLIPYPRLHFLITALSLQQPKLQSGPPMIIPAGLGIGTRRESPFSPLSLSKSDATIGHADMGVGRQGHGARVALQRAFADVLAERGQIAAALPVPPSGVGAKTGTGSSAQSPGATMANTGCITLASAFLARGHSDVVPLSDFIDCVTTAQKSLRYPSWNRNACKVRNSKMNPC